MSAAAPQAELLDRAGIHYRQWGEGPPVLALHPIGLDHHTWDRLSPWMQGFCMVAPDLPGHGDSDKPTGADYGLRSLGRRMARFIEELGWDSAWVMGNSLGGGTALALALEAPRRVRGLILINSVGYRHGLPWIGRVSQIVPRIPGAPVLLRLAPPAAMRLGLETVRRRRGSVTAECGAACRRYLGSSEGQQAFFQTLRQLYGDDLARMSSRYPEITAPALVLHGTGDPLIRQWHARELARALPHSRLQMLHHCGHFPQEECPSETGEAIRAFLREQTREPSIA